MGISDFEFSDDDEEFLKPLDSIPPSSTVGSVQRSSIQPGSIQPKDLIDVNNSTNTSITSIDYTKIPPEIKEKLYRADGEVAILKSQLQQSKTQNYQELTRLTHEYDTTKTSMEEQIMSLKAKVQSLEDQRVFLENEVRASSKKRKPNVDTQVPTVSTAKVIKIQNETSLLIDYIWKLTINGSSRTTMNYLSKICFDKPIIINNFRFTAKSPISALILEYLILQKELRLDVLFENFLDLLIKLIERLIELNLLLSVPFLLSLIHGTLLFKPLATSDNVIEMLVGRLVRVVNKFGYNLNTEEMINLNINLTLQEKLLQKFIVICAMDILEILMSFTVFNKDPGSKFGAKLYETHEIKKLLEFFIPHNIERDQNSLQINIVFNLVNIVKYVVHPTNQGHEILKKLTPLLFKLCLIDIPIKEEFKFMGLNRYVGNNEDLAKFDLIIPLDTDKLNNSIIFKPNPIINFKTSIPPYKSNFNHAIHTMELHLEIIRTIDDYIVNSLDLTVIKNKDTVRILVNILNLQLNLMKKSPRSKLIGQRIKIVANVIKILNYLFKFESEIGLIIYNDTLVELVLILLRIAFGSENLHSASSQLVRNLRLRGYKGKIFNHDIENLARETHHLTFNDPTKEIIEAEVDFPNGLEYPFDNETIELSREILGKVINTEAADNLYININGDILE